MSLSETSLPKRLLTGVAVAALALTLAACSDEKETAKAPETGQATTESAATTEAGVSPITTGSTETKLPEAEGDVDMAEVLKPGALPEMAIGPEDAPVTIVEYMSMTCPHCAAFHSQTFEGIKEKYVDTGKVRFILREFPLDARAMAAIMLARCAPEGQYFPMVSALFKSQNNWATAQDGRAALLQMAKLAGFTQESFEACLTNQKLLDDVTKVREMAANDFGVQSTPTFFINGQRYAGGMSVAEMSAIIDAASE